MVLFRASLALFVAFACASCAAQNGNQDSLPTSNPGSITGFPSSDWTIVARSEQNGNIHGLSRVSIRRSQDVVWFSWVINYQKPQNQLRGAYSSYYNAEINCRSNQMDPGRSLHYSMRGSFGNIVLTVAENTFSIQPGTVADQIKKFVCLGDPQPNPGASLEEAPAARLVELVDGQCASRGWSRGSANFIRCQQELRVTYAASGVANDILRVNRMLGVSGLAERRCAEAGLRRGTAEFANCSIAAQANISSEMTNSAQVERQQAAQAAAQADLQLAIERARADAERDRRDRRDMRMLELGLGMAAGATPRPSASDGNRTYNINGRIYHCNTTGAFTNCF